MMDYWNITWDMNNLKEGQLYPTLLNALHNYVNADGYTITECGPFTAKLEKEGIFSDSTVTLTVQDDGSVYIGESGIFGEEKIFPKTAGAPTPQEYMQMLPEIMQMIEGGEIQDPVPSQALDTGTIFFLMFGKIAKADGQVSKEEINLIEIFMALGEYDQDVREIAIEIFNEGQTTARSFYEIAAEFAQCDTVDTQDILESLLAFACADGVLHATEEQYLNDAVTAFGLSPDILGQTKKNCLFRTKEGYNNLIRASFLMFGKMTKADGQVSKEKIDVVDAVLAEFDQDTQKTAIKNFNEGQTTTRSFYEIAAEFAQCDTEDLQAILECLLALAYANGVLHVIEEQYLKDAVTAFGLSLDILTQAREEILPDPDIIEDYDILGCDPSVSGDELKRHYRELSLQYHPDRISSKDLAPDFHKFAKEKFQEIQNAYETITEHRKMVNNFRSEKNKNLINIFRLYRNTMNCLQNLE